MSIEFVKGVNTKLELISKTHGAVRVPLAQNFDYTPAFDEKRIFEFDSADAVAIVTNFNGVEVRFDHFDSSSKLVDAMVNDVSPAAAAILDDPAHYSDMNIILNVRGSNGKIFQSVLCKSVRLNGAASSEPVRDEGVMARSGIAINAYRMKGVAIEYTRCLRDASTAFAQGAANSNVDKEATAGTGIYTWDVANTPTVVSANDANISGKALILVLRNGDIYTGATLIDKAINIPSSDFNADDVFEAFTTYVDA